MWNAAYLLGLGKGKREIERYRRRDDNDLEWLGFRRSVEQWGIVRASYYRGPLFPFREEKK